MIQAIKIQNYQSIRDEVTLDFTVGKQAPADDRYVDTTIPHTRVALIQAFIGANGSGKTTSLRALTFVKWLITKSFRNGDRDLPLRQFAGYGKEKHPTNIEVTFEMKKDVYIYRLSLMADRILREELLVRAKSKQKITNKRIFERQWDAKLSTYVISDFSFGISEVFWQSGELSRSSIIAVAARFGNEYAKKITKCWSKVETNIEVEDRYRSYETTPWYALDYYQSHPKMRSLVEDDIKRYDLGIAGFGKDGKFIHKYGSDSFTLDFDQESSGTQQLLIIKRMVENVLANGGVAIIDEPDAFLHPHMLQEIVERFSNETVNKGKGQLFFSTHDIYVLDFLHKYEINITSKGNGVTSFKRLDTYQGVRNTDNFVKKYFEGIYGGLPAIEPKS